jgi:adenylylsulfate kinase-like enzyme
MHDKAEAPNCSVTNTAEKSALGHFMALLGMINVVHFISFFQNHSNYHRALSKDDYEQSSFFF